VKRGSLIGDSDTPLLVLGSWPISSGGLCLQNFWIWPGCPHHQQTGRPFRRRSGGVGVRYYGNAIWCIDHVTTENVICHSIFWKQS
jgi:hypothetical protein